MKRFLSKCTIFHNIFKSGLHFFHMYHGPPFFISSSQVSQKCKCLFILTSTWNENVWENGKDFCSDYYFSWFCFLWEMQRRRFQQIWFPRRIRLWILNFCLSGLLSISVLEFSNKTESNVLSLQVGRSCCGRWKDP